MSVNAFQELGHFAADGLRRHGFGASLGIAAVVASVVVPRIDLWPAGLEQVLREEAASLDALGIEIGMPEAEVRKRLGSPCDEEVLPPAIPAGHDELPPAGARRRLAFRAVEGWAKEIYLDGEGRVLAVRYAMRPEPN